MLHVNYYNLLFFISNLFPLSHFNFLFSFLTIFSFFVYESLCVCMVSPLIFLFCFVLIFVMKICVKIKMSKRNENIKKIFYLHIVYLIQKIIIIDWIYCIVINYSIYALNLYYIVHKLVTFNFSLLVLYAILIMRHLHYKGSDICR